VLSPASARIPQQPRASRLLRLFAKTKSLSFTRVTMLKKTDSEGFSPVQKRPTWPSWRSSCRSPRAAEACTRTAAGREATGLTPATRAPRIATLARTQARWGANAGAALKAAISRQGVEMEGQPEARCKRGQESRGAFFLFFGMESVFCRFFSTNENAGYSLSWISRCDDNKEAPRAQR